MPEQPVVTSSYAHHRTGSEASIEITGVAGLDQAGPGQLTFFGNPKLRPQLEATRASAVIMPEEAAAVARPMLRTAHPYFVFARALEVLHPRPKPAPGISPLASVADGAVLGEGVQGEFQVPRVVLDQKDVGAAGSHGSPSSVK